MAIFNLVESTYQSSNDMFHLPKEKLNYQEYYTEMHIRELLYATCASLHKFNGE